jgi:uncharacterized RDD family membrane protein YckC
MGKRVPAGLTRRALSLVYEALLLVAVLMIGALPFAMLLHDVERVAARPLFQLYVVVLAGTYFIWQWLRGGQTLAMKAWRLRIVTDRGDRLTLQHGFRRYLAALGGTVLFGAGFLWALVDRDRQFLHDRIAGTRIVREEGG